jgi:hypothetical protein
MTNNGSNMTLGSTIGTGTGTLFSKNNFFTALNYGTTGSPLYEEILGYSYDATARFALQTSNSYTNNQGTGFRFKITDGAGTAIYPITVTNATGVISTSSRLNVNGATDNGVDAVNVSGKGLFSDRLQATHFKTNSAVASIPSLTPTTIFSAAANGRYEVYAYINGGNATNYAAIATVITEGGTSRIVANNATFLQLTVSGTNVQATHQSTNPSDVYYSYLLITN